MIATTSTASIGVMIQGALAVVFGTIVACLGGWDTNLEILLIFMLLDIISGMYVAFIGKSHNSATGFYSSRKFARGITKKILMLCIVALAFGLDQVLHTDSLRNITVMFFIFNEAISVIENCECAGVPIPHKLRKLLEVYHEGGFTEGDDEFVDLKLLTKSKLSVKKEIPVVKEYESPTKEDEEEKKEP